jgi:hypothetical protein
MLHRKKIILLSAMDKTLAGEYDVISTEKQIFTGGIYYIIYK